MRMKQHRAVVEEFDWVLITSPWAERVLANTEARARELMTRLEKVRSALLDYYDLDEEGALRLLREGYAIEVDTPIGGEPGRIVLAYSREVDRPAVVVMHATEVDKYGLGEE